MKLYGSLTSPYVRKVRIVLFEKGVPCDFIVEGPSDAAGNVARLNPLGKVPVLVRPNGEVMFDSPIICEYLDELQGAPLIPEGESRWEAQRWHALGQGITDAVVARLMETRRPPERQETAVIQKQERKVAAALKFASAEHGGRDYLVDGRFGIADIALGVALAYIDLRWPHDWRANHRGLAQWFASISARPSFMNTAPPG
jgi:glutathione S-transferase